MSKGNFGGKKAAPFGKGKKRRSKKARRGTATIMPALKSKTVQMSDADDDGKRYLFRKKILPDGQIVYPRTKLHPGGPVKFDAPYRKQLIDAFNDKAYDAPPLQWATAGNAHNMLPERTGGHVVELSEARSSDVDGPGLYATIQAHSKRDARILRRNASLGVSPEIVQGLRRVDGKTYPLALRHVLGVLDPRVRSLGPFRAVSLSDDDPGQVIDLSGADYEEITVGKQKNKGKGAKVLDLSDDDLETALQAAADELETLELSATTADGGALLSLAAENAAIREDVDEIRAEAARRSWKGLKKDLTRGNFAVSKKVLDLAAPLLSRVGETVVQLSDADGEGSVDAAEVVRDILAEIHAGTAVIDLSDADGIGGELPDTIKGGKEGDSETKAALDQLSNRLDG